MVNRDGHKPEAEVVKPEISEHLLEHRVKRRRTSEETPGSSSGGKAMTSCGHISRTPPETHPQTPPQTPPQTGNCDVD